MMTNQLDDIVTNNNINENHQKQICCQKGSLAKYVCYSKMCKGSAFVCQSTSCQCRSQHKRCFKQEIQNVLQNMLQKSYSIEPVCKNLQSFFQKSIDELSSMRDKILIEFKQKYQLQGLSENQLKFVNSIKENKTDSINCDIMWDIVVNIYDIQKSESLEFIQTDIKGIQDKFDAQIIQFQQKLEGYFQSKQNRIHLFRDSLIIKKGEEQKILTGYFNKKIKSVQLLYRASQNEFSTVKFHQKCNNYQNTFIICQTDKNRTFGGYTAIKWNQTNGWAADPQRRSFLFDLQNNEKMVVKQDNTYQIYCKSSYGPTFGGNNDLRISDKSNTQDLYIYPGHTYAYENDNNEGKQRITSGLSFTTKQWEVYKINFA